MAEIERVIKACKYAIGDMIKRGSCYFASTDEDGYRYAIGWQEVVKSLDKIRELQELNKGLSESYTSNPMYEIGYKKGASDMEKAKQIIIDKLQSQIPKWHLVADGDLPKDNYPKLIIVNGKVNNLGFLNAYEFGEYQSGKWIIEHYENENGLEVVAWMELPKFEESEE